MVAVAVAVAVAGPGPVAAAAAGSGPAKDGSRRARALSGERSADQFVAEILINPIRSYSAVKFRGDQGCSAGAKYPEKAVLSEVPRPTGPTVKLTARAPYAPNMGFAVWKPDDEQFGNAGRYEQIYSDDGSPADNPGRVDGNGTKTVTWRYRDTVTVDLTGATVVVMAIPCLAANAPAFAERGSVTGFEISPDGGLRRRESDPSSDYPALKMDRLAQAACRART